MHNFRELSVWQRARKLNQVIYKVTKGFPDSESYGLVSQMRRASISIASNIAEGSSRNSNKDFSRFIRIALGSAFELETQLILSADLKLTAENKLDDVIVEINEIQKMLRGLDKRLMSNV